MVVANGGEERRNDFRPVEARTIYRRGLQGPFEITLLLVLLQERREIQSITSLLSDDASVPAIGMQGRETPDSCMVTEHFLIRH